VRWQAAERPPRPSGRAAGAEKKTPAPAKNTCIHGRSQVYRSRVAKILLGSILADIRGTIGDVTYSRNRGGQYASSKLVRVAPWSQRQIDSRTELSYYWPGWNNDITEDERTAWRMLAAQNPPKDRFGKALRLTGQQLWVRVQSPIGLWFEGVYATPPANWYVDPPPKITALTATASPEHIYVTFDRQPSDTSAFVLRASKCYNVGRNSFWGLLCMVNGYIGTQSYPIDIIAPYRAYHPALTATKKIAVEVRTLNLTNGVLSQSYLTTCIVA
jgi:hypothetical protein